MEQSRSHIEAEASRAPVSLGMPYFGGQSSAAVSCGKLWRGTDQSHPVERLGPEWRGESWQARVGSGGHWQVEVRNGTAKMQLRNGPEVLGWLGLDWLRCGFLFQTECFDGSYSNWTGSYKWWRSDD